jgi:hypothetical protein
LHIAEGWPAISSGPAPGFPNASGDAFSAFAFNHKALLKQSGTQGWTLHDLRRTFATGLARLSTPIHVTEKILNHVSGSVSGVAAIYNRYDYWDERVAALAAWEKHVLQLVSAPRGAPTGSSEEVTPNENPGSGRLSETCQALVISAVARLEMADGLAPYFWASVARAAAVDA